MWNYGDLAALVEDVDYAGFESCHCSPPLIKGGYYIISDFVADKDFLWDGDELGLLFEGYGCDECYYPAQSFRKVPPLSDEEKDEFLVDIRPPVFA